MKRILGALVFALAVAPLGLLAQSKAPEENVCLRACQVEYDSAVRACANAANQAACVQTADGAFKTCMAVCPANK
jgi:hypothetical protein